MTVLGADDGFLGRVDCADPAHCGREDPCYPKEQAAWELGLLDRAVCWLPAALRRLLRVLSKGGAANRAAVLATDTYMVICQDLPPRGIPQISHMRNPLSSLKLTTTTITKGGDVDTLGESLGSGVSTCYLYTVSFTLRSCSFSVLGGLAPTSVLIRIVILTIVFPTTRSLRDC